MHLYLISIIISHITLNTQELIKNTVVFMDCLLYLIRKDPIALCR